MKNYADYYNGNNRMKRREKKIKAEKKPVNPVVVCHNTAWKWK